MALIDEVLLHHQHKTKPSLRIWEVWIDEGRRELPGNTDLQVLMSSGCAWTKKLGTSGDYPVWRLGVRDLNEFGVVTLDDLDKVPFEIFWPQKS